MRGDRIDQQLPPLAVERPHAAHVRGQIAVHDELGQHGLLHQLPFAIKLGDARAKRIDELFRHDHVAHPQARKQHLPETADVDHLPGFVESLQRRERPAAVAEFAVVVVLDDPDVVLAREFEQRAAAREAHHHAERILMRRRDEREPRRLLQSRSSGLSPSPSTGIGTSVSPRRLQHAAHAPVARFLDPRAVAEIGEQAHGKVDRLMDARRDDDLVRRAFHRARDAQIIRQRAPQRPIAAARRVGQQTRDWRASRAAPASGSRCARETRRRPARPA